MANTFKKAVKKIIKKVECVYLELSPRFKLESLEYIIAKCEKRKIPLFIQSDNVSKTLGIISIAPDYDQIGNQAARLAKKIINLSFFQFIKKLFLLQYIELPHEKSI